MTEISPKLDYATPAPAAGGVSLYAWLKKLAPLFGLVLVVLLFSALRPNTFATTGNLEIILTQTAVVGIAALGMTMIIISGGIDLSVGSALALCTVVVAQALSWRMPPLAAAATAVLAGAATGLVIGLLVVGLRLIAFIVTLGMLGILRGLAQLIAPNGRMDAPATWLNELLNPFGDYNILVPPGVWLMLALALVIAGVLRYTKFGRHVFAIGSNEQTAKLCGVPVDRTKLLVYVFAGALNGVAGTLLFSSMTMADSTSANGYELNVIAAVVIGGASLAGGEGTVLGSLVGAMLMTVIANGCTKMGWPNPWQRVDMGVIIILAVALDRLRHRRAE